jgi:hypothetical protein
MKKDIPKYLYKEERLRIFEDDPSLKTSYSQTVEFFNILCFAVDATKFKFVTNNGNLNNTDGSLEHNVEDYKRELEKIKSGLIQLQGITYPQNFGLILDGIKTDMFVLSKKISSETDITSSWYR